MNLNTELVNLLSRPNLATQFLAPTPPLISRLRDDVEKVENDE
jgi:hypothetical protein